MAYLIAKSLNTVDIDILDQCLILEFNATKNFFFSHIKV